MGDTAWSGKRYQAGLGEALRGNLSTYHCDSGPKDKNRASCIRECSHALNLKKFHHSLKISHMCERKTPFGPRWPNLRPEDDARFSGVRTLYSSHNRNSEQQDRPILTGVSAAQEILAKASSSPILDA